MFRQFLIVLVLGGMLLAACGGKKITGDEAYPSPTSVPSGSDLEVQPYPLEEINPTIVVNPEGSYPAPDNVEPPAAGDEEDFAPKPGDEDKIRNDVLIEGAVVRTAVSDANEFMLDLNGSLRNPCYELRVVVQPPNEEDRIDVDVYAVLSPDSICTQVLSPYKASVLVGTYTGGKYTVWVNGEKIGDIQP